jgi:naphthoate synthase
VIGTYANLIIEDQGPVTWITLNRPDHGNSLTPESLRELKDALDRTRADRTSRVIVLTGSGDRFFCVGGEKTGPLSDLHYGTVMPIIDVYQLIEQHPKPIIACVNGYAVGGGNVLQMVCDLTIAKASAIFRQVGPLVGSFDAGFGTWYLEDLIGRKRAKEMWFLNEKLTASRALEIGLINRVVPDEQLGVETQRMAEEIAQRGSQALAAVKLSFGARTGGVAGFSRISHDLLLRYYLESEESRELQSAFRDDRPADPARFAR